MALATSFMVRFTYGAGPTVFDFPDPAWVVIPDPVPIAVAHEALSSGERETLFLRFEHRVRLAWTHQSSATIASLYAWWSTHAALGKPTAIDLNRVADGGTQWEYTQYRTFFSLAELVDPRAPFGVTRSVLTRPLYSAGFMFRQGVA